MTTVIANRPITLGVARRKSVGNSGPSSICCVRDVAGVAASVAALAPIGVVRVLIRASASGHRRNGRTGTWIQQIHGRLGREPLHDLPRTRRSCRLRCEQVNR